MQRPVSRKEWNTLVKLVREALRLVSKHDPDHELRLTGLERQMRRLGTPQYPQRNSQCRDVDNWS